MSRSVSSAGAAVVFSIAAVLAGCSSEPEHCRFDPTCGGGIGSFCETSSDCEGGFCCTRGTDANCGVNGMCTYECSVPADCPSDMGCEHGLCFFACTVDADCAVGQSCEHGNTICEWP